MAILHIHSIHLHLHISNTTTTLHYLLYRNTLSYKPCSIFCFSITLGESAYTTLLYDMNPGCVLLSKVPFRLASESLLYHTCPIPDFRSIRTTFQVAVLFFLCHGGFGVSVPLVL